MSLIAYDQALLDYLKGALAFDNIINASEDSAFNESVGDDLIDGKSHRHDANVKFPLVSFWRTSCSLAQVGGGNFMQRRTGRLVDKDKETCNGVRWRSLPISLSYQITIWSDKLEETDDIFRELIMYLVTDNPHISIQLEGMIKPQQFMLEVTDTDSGTDPSSFDDKGKIYTQHILVDVTEAQLFFSRDIKLAREIPIRVVPLKDDGFLKV